MGITLFNWPEILVKSRKDMAAIIILAYAQTKVYNEYSSRTLMKRLNIHHIPLFMFRQKLLKQEHNKLVCTYYTEQPQSYFKNPAFLFSGASVKHKVVYLKALSMRRMGEIEDKIPLEYFDTLSYNPFLEVKDNYIYFTQESSVSRNT